MVSSVKALTEVLRRECARYTSAGQGEGTRTCFLQLPAVFLKMRPSEKGLERALAMETVAGMLAW